MPCRWVLESCDCTARAQSLLTCRTSHSAKTNAIAEQVNPVLALRVGTFSLVTGGNQGAAIDAVPTALTRPIRPIALRNWHLDGLGPDCAAFGNRRCKRDRK